MPCLWRPLRADRLRGGWGPSRKGSSRRIHWETWSSIHRFMARLEGKAPVTHKSVGSKTTTSCMQRLMPCLWRLLRADRLRGGWGPLRKGSSRRILFTRFKQPFPFKNGLFLVYSTIAEIRDKFDHFGPLWWGDHVQTLATLNPKPRCGGNCGGTLRARDKFDYFGPLGGPAGAEAPPWWGDPAGVGILRV